jgi:hypothetical protein
MTTTNRVLACTIGLMCGYRTGPGVAEVHLKETDVFYVLDGAATFVTGGKVQGVTSTDPLQPRVSHFVVKVLKS